MHYNVAVVGGRLTAPPEARPGEPGSWRLLVDVQSDWPQRRHDLVPVIYPGVLEHVELERGDMLWAVGSLQRRFSAQTGHSRLELVAFHVERQDP